MTQTPINFPTVVIAGCGLLGGSLGMALRRRGLARRVVGVGRSEQRLRQAVELGAADTATADLAAACREADLVVLCTPVSVIREQLDSALRHAPPSALITDVGSTKSEVCCTARALRQAITGQNAAAPAVFIGSHPMAGSDRSGIIHADANLYENSTCFVVIDPGGGDLEFNCAARLTAFWQAVGCRVVFTTPARHDALAAAVSHLPHFLAVALAEAVRRTGETPELLRAIVGNGFRDTTRVAAGDPSMWRDIAASNTAAIRAQIAALRRALDDLDGQLDPGRAGELDRLLRDVQTWRRLFDL
ncbi:MAG: prephenate dehydrogenase/arogenate dehydrogenase family protein [Candidatus Sumerlaeia bacterium]